MMLKLCKPMLINRVTAAVFSVVVGTISNLELTHQTTGGEDILFTLTTLTCVSAQ